MTSPPSAKYPLGVLPRRLRPVGQDCMKTALLAGRQLRHICNSGETERWRWQGSQSSERSASFRGCGGRPSNLRRSHSMTDVLKLRCRKTGLAGDANYMAVRRERSTNKKPRKPAFDINMSNMSEDLRCSRGLIVRQGTERRESVSCHS